MRQQDEDDYVAYVTSRGPALRRTAYLMCGDWHRAQDITQTALAKLYARWRRARQVEHLDAYARQVLVRVFLDEQRLSWFRTRRDIEVPDRGHEFHADDRLMLLSALAKVAPRQRAVLVLRFWEDLSVEQTATTLRCSTGNVKSQTARGLATMRRLLPEFELLAAAP